MPKMIQIRNVPDDLHRTLKVRAAHAGMTLSDYLLAEVEQVAARPTLAEMSDRLAQLEPTGIALDSIVKAVREDRDAR
ncbi:MAG TPA: hypothetical protein VIM22_04660 [Solirubrobacteraceae bacterium]